MLREPELSTVMSKYRRAIFAIITLGILGGCLLCIMTFIQTIMPVEPNSLMAFKRYYGVNEDAVAEVSAVYGIPVEDFPKYGLRPFPANYIKHTLGWDLERAERPIVYRQEIEALVKGYVSRCDSEQNTIYLFYSDWLRPHNLFHNEAMVIEVTYRQDQTLESFHVYGAGSSDGGWSREIVAPTCDPPAKY